MPLEVRSRIKAEEAFSSGARVTSLRVSLEVADVP